MTGGASKGKCNLCGKTYSKSGMTRHLQSCTNKKTTTEPRAPGKKLGKAESLVLSVEGRHNPQYWLYLEMPLKTKLADLDFFLRNIWLECCGHLSAFTIRGEHYGLEPDYDYDDYDMDTYLSKVLSTGEYFTYEYDFGSTTELTLKVIGTATKIFPDSGIAVLARNDQPQYRCDYCDKIAVEICQECEYEGKGMLCEECAEKHPCGEDMLLPVVNSPRVGTCAYTG